MTTIGAERAARAVLAGEASGVPKSGDGRVEMIRGPAGGPPLRYQSEDLKAAKASSSAPPDKWVVNGYPL